MQLKKLEVFGFKSFADRTEFTFEPGVTGFVGPNGCGKSNVVDAVKWILGEQSAKSLRGNEMADVIFNGDRGRRSQPYAEASLTIDNSRGLLPVDFQEVKVTRRLHRSGESQYLINNAPCRLRDIRELFMDTGVGTSSYSVIEQGKVDRLLQANAQERREVFEEAAGISKYKAKKKAALSKLDRVDQNLLRVEDIIEEVRRQLRSVRAQAGRAKRYKELSGKLRDLRVALGVRDYRRLGADAGQVAKRLAELQDQVQGVAAGISRLEAEIAVYEESAITLDQDIQQTQERRGAIDVGMTDAEARIQHNRQRIDEMGELEIRLDQQATTLAERLTELRRELETAQATLVALRQEVASTETEVQQMQGEVEGLAQARAELAAGIERRKADVIEIMRDLSLTQNELTSSQSTRAGYASTRRRLQTRSAEIDGEVSQLSQERDELRAQQARLQAEIGELSQRFVEAQDAHRRETEAGERMAQELSEAMQTRSARESRRDVLREMEVRAEGIDASVQHVLAGAAGSPGVVGTLVDHISVDTEHALAIDAALGTASVAVLTDSTADAVAAMGQLARDGKGRCAFLPQDRLRSRELANSGLLHDPSVVGRASELVRAQDRARTAVDHLLGNTVVVQDVHAAARFATNGGADCRLVTLDGQVFEPRGAVMGGSRESAMGIVSRRAELVALEQELVELDLRLEELRGQRETHLAEAERQRQRIEQTREDIDERRLKQHGAESEAAQRQREIAGLADERELAESEMQDIMEWLQDAEQREAELTEKTETLQARSAAIEQEVVQCTAELAGKDEMERTLAARLTDLRIEHGRKQEQMRGLVESTSGIERSLREREEERRTAIRGAEEAVHKAQEARTEITRCERLMMDLSEQKEIVEEQFAGLTARREELRRQLGESNEQVSALRGQLRELEEETHQHKLRDAEVRGHMATLSDRLRDDYDLDLAQLVLDQPEDPDMDWEQVQADIESHREQLGRMGSVNLEALKELDELEVREQFLSSQRDDLLRSKGQLEDIIRRINRTSRELFEATFIAVRENFQETFRKLFGGGSADIRLEEGVDILEAGIEIIARPPGKQPRSISLLSGGEKTMTTVALLFSIFKTKPSPFCILDEVDAALDESNIARFVAMVQEFVPLSQFIIVTHSKRTMAVADTLYGITMQESGISKKVSVTFEGDAKLVA